MAWKEHKDAIQTCRDRIRKAKVQMEMTLVRDVKIRKVSMGMLIRRERPRTVQGRRRENWQQQSWGRLRYLTSSLPQFSLAIGLLMSLMSLKLQAGLGE